MEWIVLAAIGFVAGTIGALIGLGGGIIIVPSLLYLSEYTNLLDYVTPQIAVGTSTFIMIFTGLSSTLSYMKYKTVDYKSGFLFFAGSAPGVVLGAWTNKFLNVDTFYIYFGIFVIFMSLLLMVKDKLKPISIKPKKENLRQYTDPEGKTWEYGYHPAAAISISFVVGFISGIFGIGGGSLMVPAMILLFLFPPHVAVATSMFMIFLTSLVNSTTHIVLGNVNWLYASALIPGAWIGARFGAFINQKTSSKAVVFLFRIILFFIGLRLIFQG